jgi:AraC family transcriptional regulator
MWNTDTDQSFLAPGVHFGNIQSVNHIGGLIVAESRYGRLLRTPFHRHETSSFTMVFDGGYREEFAVKKFECGSGSALYRPAGEVHRDYISRDGARCLMVEMSNAWLEGMAVRGLSLRGPWQARDGAGLAMRIRNELVFWDELTALAIEALVTELACRVQRGALCQGRAPIWLTQLRDRIEAEFAHLPSLALLATDLDVHPGHMSRCFRRQFGCTIGEYARRRKVAYCCEQLRCDRVSLCDIASQAGFSSQAHMTRVFRLQTSMTPAEFRRLHGQR